MRVIFLCADLVWPPTAGGRIRTLSQLRALSSLDEVERITLFTLSEEATPAHTSDDVARELPKVELLGPVFHPVHLWRHPRHVPHVVWLRVARGIPYLAAKWDSREVRAALARVLGAWRFDVVWLGSLGLARYLPLLRELQPRARVVLDGHNVESDIWAQFASRQTGISKRVAEAEWSRARGFERDVLRAVDAVAAISHDDALAYGDLADVHARFVPQVVPFTRRAPPTTPERTLCYVGTLSWRPNVRGLDWFCREVWPLVRDRLPDATLDIAGAGLPTDAAGAPIAPPAWRLEGVNVLGFVDDVAPIYVRAAAMVAPHLEGTGVRMKLLEAFRHGVPLITTPAGATGLPIAAGREALVESDPQALATAVVAAATDAGLQQRLREAGYAFLERHHGLAAAQDALRPLLGLPSDVAIPAAPVRDAAPRDGPGRSRRTALAFPRSR